MQRDLEVHVGVGREAILKVPLNITGLEHCVLPILRLSLAYNAGKHVISRSLPMVHQSLFVLSDANTRTSNEPKAGRPYNQQRKITLCLDYPTDFCVS